MSRRAILGLAVIVIIGVIVTLLLTRVHVSGAVVDRGGAVPRAKIIVSAWNVGIFDSNPHRCTTLTDSKGRFRVSKAVGFPIRRLDLEALFEGGRYGFKEVHGGHHRLELRSLEGWEKEFEARFSYPTFSGRWGGGRDLNCQEWTRTNVWKKLDDLTAPVASEELP